MNGTISQDVALWGLVVGVVLPLLVGIVTRATTPPGVKAVLLAALAAVTVVIQEALQDGSFETKAAILKFAGLFLTAVGLHFGLLKPTNVTGAGGAVSQIGPK